MKEVCGPSRGLFLRSPSLVISSHPLHWCCASPLIICPLVLLPWGISNASGAVPVRSWQASCSRAALSGARLVAAMQKAEPPDLLLLHPLPNLTAAVKGWDGSWKLRSSVKTKLPASFLMLQPVCVVCIFPGTLLSGLPGKMRSARLGAVMSVEEWVEPQLQLSSWGQFGAYFVGQAAVLCWREQLAVAWLQMAALRVFWSFCLWWCLLLCLICCLHEVLL